MKKLVFALAFIAVLFGLDLYSVYAYDMADTLQFPLDSYSTMENIRGTYNAVGNNKYHLGEDVHASATTRVYAIGNGKVMHAKDHPSKRDSRGNLIRNYGGMYIIEHTLPNGKRACSLGAHMDFATFTKKEGDLVRIGDYLGEVGTTAQNGGWPEHFHFGILKGGYPENPSEYICGDWIFSGYTTCESVVKNWYAPTAFINNQDTYLPYRRVGNVAWFPMNKSCSHAEKWVYFDKNGNGSSMGSLDICFQEANRPVAF